MSCEKYGISEKEDVCFDAVTKAEEMHAVAIVVQSHSNETARWLSKYHGAQPIFVCTDNELIMHQLDGYYRACRAIQSDHEMTTEELVNVIHQAGYMLDSGVIIVVNDWNSKVFVSDVSI